MLSINPMHIVFGNKKFLIEKGIIFSNKKQFKHWDSIIIRMINKMWKIRRTRMIELTNNNERIDVLSGEQLILFSGIFKILVQK